MLLRPRKRSSRTLDSSSALVRLLICLGLALSLAPGCSPQKKSKKKKTWNGKGSFRCGRAQRVTLRKLTVVASSRTNINVYGHCKLALVDCNFKGDVRMVARENAQITITGGRLETKKTAVRAMDRAEIRMTGAWVMGGGEGTRSIGLRADDESHVVVVGSHIQGGGDGLRADGKSRVELSDTKVIGAYGITARRRTRVKVSGGTVEGNRYAILTYDQSQVTHHGTRVTGSVLSKGSSKVIVRKGAGGKVKDPELPSVMK